MNQVKRSGDLLSEERRNECVKAIIAFFQEERGEQIGVIAAESFLDFFMQSVGQELFNKGVLESQRLLKSRFEDIELDLDLLLKK